MQQDRGFFIGIGTCVVSFCCKMQEPSCQTRHNLPYFAIEGDRFASQSICSLLCGAILPKCQPHCPWISLWENTFANNERYKLLCFKSSLWRVCFFCVPYLTLKCSVVSSPGSYHLHNMKNRKINLIIYRVRCHTHIKFYSRWLATFTTFPLVFRCILADPPRHWRGLASLNNSQGQIRH